MGVLKKILVVLFCGGTLPAAGSRWARRIALLFFSYRPVLGRLAVLTGCGVLAVLFQSHYWLLLLCIYGALLGGAIAEGGRVRRGTLLPVDDGEAFRWQFFPGFLFLLIVGGCVGCCGMRMPGLASVERMHLGLAITWAPAALFTACFAEEQVRGRRLIIGLMVLLCSVIPLGLFIIWSPAGVPVAAGLILHLLVVVGLLRWFYRMSLAGALFAADEELLPEPAVQESVARGKGFPGKKDALESPRPVYRELCIPQSQRAGVSEGKSHSIPGAMRRKALWRFAYGGLLTRVKWMAGVWLALLPFFPAALQMLLHLFFTACVMQYVLSRIADVPGALEAAHLLPVSRRELLFLRVMPLLALQCLMTAMGFLFASVLGVPEWIFGSAVRTFDLSDGFVYVTFLMGPLVFTFFGVIDMVWPVGAPRLRAGLFLSCIFLPPLFEKLDLRVSQINPGAIMGVGFALVFGGLGAAFLACNRREILGAP